MNGEKDKPLELPVGLRDYFAAKALAGYLANADARRACPRCGGVESAAEFAYKMADALLAAREKS